MYAMDMMDNKTNNLTNMDQHERNFQEKKRVEYKT